MNTMCDGEYFYSVELRDESTNRVIRYNMEGNNLTQLSPDEHNVHMFCSTENYLYYNLRDEISIGKDSSGNDIMVRKSDIYRVPKDGGEAELVYSLPDDMKTHCIFNFLVDGNYLYALYGAYNPETKTVDESQNNAPYDFLRINLTTGDIYYITE